MWALSANPIDISSKGPMYTANVEEAPARLSHGVQMSGRKVGLRCTKIVLISDYRIATIPVPQSK